MKINIHTLVNEKCKFNFEKEIQKALTVVPKDNLRELFQIIVQYEPPSHNADAMGSYFGVREGVKEPYILLSMENILSCFPSSIPVLSKFLFRLYLRDTLYHEIGHHYQRLIHGIKKDKWENHAEEYSKKMQREMYRKSFVGRILFSFAGAVKSFKKGSRKIHRKY